MRHQKNLLYVLRKAPTALSIFEPAVSPVDLICSPMDWASFFISWPLPGSSDLALEDKAAASSNYCEHHAIIAIVSRTLKFLFCKLRVATSTVEIVASASANGSKREDADPSSRHASLLVRG